MNYTEQFQSDLARDSSPEVQAFWQLAFSKAFKNYQSAEFVKNITEQLSGIDVWVEANEKKISIELKTDYTNYTNIIFEVESTQGYSKGWAEKEIAADVFAYGFKNQGICYFFTTTELLGVWKEHQSFWKQQYGTRTVWSSRAIVTPVPIPVVLEAVSKSRVIQMPEYDNRPAQAETLRMKYNQLKSKE